MKPKSTIIAGVLALVVGIILIVCNNLINDRGIVTTGGILFILAAVVNALFYLNNRDKDGKARRGNIALVFGWIGCAAALILGVAMLIFGEQFMTLIPWVFGLLLFFAALVQLYSLAIGVRPYILPGWFYAFPVAILIGAALVLFYVEAENVRLIVTGVSVVFFGIGSLCEGIALAQAHKQAQAAETTQSTNLTDLTDTTHNA